VKNPPVSLESGRWVAGASVESPADDEGAATWDCFADVSDDDGLTWTRSAEVPVDHASMSGPGIIQPAVWVGSEGLVFLMRSSTGRAWRAVSRDEGCTWSPAEATDLPNNNSGLGAVRLPDGRVVAAHNTSTTSWGPRNELALSVSTDQGRSWRQALMLDALPPPSSSIAPGDAGIVTDGEGELSYPTVICQHDDVVVSYTRERREIVVATVAISTLT
jgi:predicted neuraminidase